MQVKYYAWFETKHEKTEFIHLLNSCRSEMEAFAKVMDKYPNLSISQVNGIVENFKTEINKK